MSPGSNCAKSGEVLAKNNGSAWTGSHRLTTAAPATYFNFLLVRRLGTCCSSGATGRRIGSYKCRQAVRKPAVLSLAFQFRFSLSVSSLRTCTDLERDYSFVSYIVDIDHGDGDCCSRNDCGKPEQLELTARNIGTGDDDTSCVL